MLLMRSFPEGSSRNVTVEEKTREQEEIFLPSFGSTFLGIDTRRLRGGGLWEILDLFLALL